ncbi:50S ribosomal protein L24 [Clostridia bacterium]|nr:50S ribosomal protein L24 [Clostridia bacterium]
MQVKTGDKVKVIAGKDKGKEGKILSVITSSSRVIVEGVSVAKRHQRPTQQMPQGGIIEKESPISVSNVMLVCPACGETTRVGHVFLDNGSKVRVCKKCNEVVDK